MELLVCVQDLKWNYDFIEYFVRTLYTAVRMYISIVV